MAAASAVVGRGAEDKKVSAPGVPVLVQLDWIKNAQFAGVLVAEARGWYRDAGFEVTVRAVGTTRLDQITPVMEAPGLAIGVADGSALIKARVAGAPVKAFATMFQASPLGPGDAAEQRVGQRGLSQGQTLRTARV